MDVGDEVVLEIPVKRKGNLLKIEIIENILYMGVIQFTFNYHLRCLKVCNNKF